MNDECDHQPVWTSVAHAEDDIFDVLCRKCGTSGSFVVNPSDIQW